MTPATPHPRPKPELLAPAGDREALRAAVANGADAVYLGLTGFNARARAANFTPDELPEVVRFAHARGVRVFVTLNTLVFSDELPAVAELLTAVAAAGADAVIVQDLGLVRLIRRLVPSLPVHASTQMTLTEPRGVAFAGRLGVERVVLARELSLADIRKVTAAAEVPVEVFVHGALCVAYSGQCLTSEALGGRSANRGQCAQACRLPYDLVVDGHRRDLGDRAYLLSPGDLAAYDHIAPLVEAGVISFKIEGRLKGGPYVAATTQTYRKAIDAATAGKDFSLDRRDELDLAQTFSRGFVPGFLDGVNHQRLVRGRFPKSRGVRLGRVAGRVRDGVRVSLAERLPAGDLIRPGDGVVFDLGRPQDKEPGGRVWRVNPLGPGLVELVFEPGSLDAARLPDGADVYKTDDPALTRKLEATYAQDKPSRRTSVTATLAGAAGGPLTLTLADDAGRSASVTWAGPLEVARTRPATAADLRPQLDRLGDTPFELVRLVLELPDPVLVPKSVVNDLRRKAAAELAGQTTTAAHAVAEPKALAALRAGLSLPSPLEGEGGELPRNSPGEGIQDLPSPGDPASPARHPLPQGGRVSPEPRLTVLVRTLDQLDAVLAWTPPDGLPRPAAVYCDFEDLRRYKDAVPRAKAAGLPVGLATLRVLKPGEEGYQSPIVRADPDIVLVRNLGSLAYCKEHLPAAELVGDFSLNVANELTADLFIREGLSRLVPSFDLSWDQLAALLGRSPPAWYEPVVHQHMPMFHNEHCVFAALLSTGKDATDCGRPCERHRVELRDRTGAAFPVLADTGCRNTVFNGVPQSAAEYVGRMRGLGVGRFRVDLLRETPDQVGPLLERYARVVGGRDDGRAVWRELRALNQLGVTRGTLQMA